MRRATTGPSPSARAPTGCSRQTRFRPARPRADRTALSGSARRRLRDHDLDHVFGDLIRDASGARGDDGAGKAQRLDVRLRPELSCGGRVRAEGARVHLLRADGRRSPTRSTSRSAASTRNCSTSRPARPGARASGSARAGSRSVDRVARPLAAPRGTAEAVPYVAHERGEMMTSSIRSVAVVIALALLAPRHVRAGARSRGDHCRRRRR